MTSVLSKEIGSSDNRDVDVPVSRRTSKSSRKNDDRKAVLPTEFRPTPYSVIFGRGKRCSNAIGNRRLHIIASMFLRRYSNANSKIEKSHIVSDIMDTVREACPDGRGAFVKFSEGRWWEVDPLFVREKIGSILRDCLYTKYRSSTRAKLAKRRLMLEPVQNVSKGASQTIQLIMDQDMEEDDALVWKQSLEMDETYNELSDEDIADIFD